MDERIAGAWIEMDGGDRASPFLFSGKPVRIIGGRFNETANGLDAIVIKGDDGTHEVFDDGTGMFAELSYLDDQGHPAPVLSSDWNFE